MIVYENDGHRRRMMKTYHQMAWKVQEWRKDPHCRKCGKKTWFLDEPGTRADQCTIDHKRARGLGGSDTEDNFELLCSSCNTRKSRGENLKQIKLSGKFTKALWRALQKQTCEGTPVIAISYNEVESAIAQLRSKSLDNFLD